MKHALLPIVMLMVGRHLRSMLGYEKRLVSRPTGAAEARAVLLFWGLAFFGAGLHAEDANSVSTPTPTQEQLTRGQELLDKVWKTATKISLSDSIEVFKEFGITDIVSTQYPNHISISPKHIPDKEYQLLNSGITREYRGTSLRSAWNVLWMVDRREGLTARFSVDINAKDACILIGEVKKRFGNNYVRMTAPPQIHPQVDPPKMHPFYGLRYTGIEGENSIRSNVGFIFRYQECVQEFVIYYAN